MSDISQLAHVLRQYEVFRKGPSTKRGGGDFHKGLTHLRNVDHDRVAQRVLQRDWHNRKAVASMFKMAESVERLLHLDLDWLAEQDTSAELPASGAFGWRTMRQHYRLGIDGIADNHSVASPGLRMSLAMDAIHHRPSRRTS
jgi:hypothetical protein